MQDSEHVSGESGEQSETWEGDSFIKSHFPTLYTKILYETFTKNSPLI